MTPTKCEPCDEAFRIFTCLWGQMQLLRLCASLCRSQHTLLEWLSSTGPPANTLLLSCLLCVAVPDEATIVAALCSSLASAWASLPCDSGGIFELLAHLNLLAGLGWSLLTGRPACEGWVAAGPAIRCLATLVFVFAALARLNRDFHDPCRSASTILILRVVDRLGSLRVPMKGLVELASDRIILMLLRLCFLIVEVAGVAVPLLLWRGPVLLGLCLAWVFALAMASTAAFDFACLLVACLPLWVPPQRVLALRWMTLSTAARSASAAVGVSLLGPALLRRSGVHHRVQLICNLWLLAACPLQYAVPELLPPAVVTQTACATEAAGRAITASSGGLVHQVAKLTILLALLNGVCPYLGLKTQATWTLLSNLHVEGGATNHLIIPAVTQIFGFTHDCVTVTKTNVPLLQELHTVDCDSSRLRVFQGFVDRMGVEVAVHANVSLCKDIPEDGDVLMPYSLPLFELRRIISVQTMPLIRDFFVEYVHCGAPHRFEVRHGVPLPGSDPRLAQVPASVLQKVLAFRSFPARGPRGVCTL